MSLSTPQREQVKTCSRCVVSKLKTEWHESSWSRAGGWCVDCYREWHRSRYTPSGGEDDQPRDCSWCGASFRPGQRRPSQFCSRACKDKGRNSADSSARVASKTSRPCMHCGAIIGPARRADAVFCSPECNSRAHALRRKLRARGGTDTDGYVRAEVFERDGWICGICAEPVDRTVRWPDGRCASLDHIVPLAHGGTNDTSNLRLTHLTCNCRRGARV